MLASHVIISTYGFWLPNDPRGSWSDFVGAWELTRFGRSTRVQTRRSVAGRDHDHWSRREAKKALRYPPVVLTGLQARAVARGFADRARRSGVIIWACSILPEHVHLVIKRHHYDIDQVVNLLKGSATRKLDEEGVHPLDGHRTRSGRAPKPWGRKHWKVFLDTEADVRRAVGYVEGNPEREGKKPQTWSFAKRPWSDL